MLQSLSTLDHVALALFLVAWLGTEPALRWLGRRRVTLGSGSRAMRRAWMRALVRRDNRIPDSNLLGHALHSASFFGSANVLLIGAAFGALVSGGAVFASVDGLGMLDIASPAVFEMKMVLVTLTLVRGLFALIWSIRQITYCLALFGAVGEDWDEARREAFAEAMTEVFDPAMASLTEGVRAYHFALAAASWMLGPVALIAATITVPLLFLHRQTNAAAARGMSKANAALRGDVG
jgi:uncharacterized membrane protein